MQKLSIAIT